MSYQEQGGGGESVVVNGTVEGMEVKNNGRFVIKVRELGSTSNYALSLNTKEQGLAQQMANSIGQQFSFICGLSHWTNNQGQPVTSKWINGVAPLQGGYQQPQPQQQFQPQPQQFQGQPQGFAGQQPQQPFMPQQQPQQQFQPQPQFSPQEDGRPTDDAYIRRVSWLAAVPAAVAALDHLPEDQRTVAALVKMTDFLARTAIIRGQQGFPGTEAPAPAPQAQPQYQQQPQQQQYQGDPGPQGFPPTDDDIPF